MVEDGRPVVVASLEVRLVRPLATGTQRGPVLQRLGDVALDLLAVPGADQRPGLRLRVERAPEPDALGAADQLGDELLVDGVLDDQARTGRADLAGVEEDRGEGVVDGGFEVGVGEDHVRVLAAELERDLLHRARRRGHDLAAGLQTTGEGDQVHLGCLGERRSHVGAGAQDQVGDPGGYAGLGERLHQPDRRRRGQLARLEHERVARGDRGRDLPGGLQEREVPRGDERAHADRLVDDAAGDLGHARVDHPAGVGVGEVRVVTEDGDDVVDVDLGLDQALAGVEGLEAGDLGLLGLELVGDPVEDAAPLGRGGLSPGTVVERPACGSDRCQGVVSGALRDGGDQRTVRGTVDLPCPLVCCVLPVSVDEELGHSNLSSQAAPVFPRQGVRTA